MARGLALLELAVFCGTLIPGTTFTWLGVPDDGFVYVLSVDPLTPPVTIPDTVWMVVEFTTDDALWVLSDQAEVGFTEDTFGIDQSPWGCTFWFGGNPYAGMWANLRCVETAARAADGDGTPIDPQLHTIRLETAAPTQLMSEP